MWKILNNEVIELFKQFKKLEYKTVVIFLCSTFLFTISWYFSNPNFFSEQFIFHKSFDLIYEDLTAFSYWFLSDTILFLIIPFLIIVFHFHERIKDYGISLREKKVGFSIVFFSILLLMPIIILITSTDSFHIYFPLMKSATDDFGIFILYESLFILFIFSWEFIFRGFILFGLEKKFGFYSILIQMIPFVILHNGKPFIETFAAIFGALLLGYLAIRTRSIFYGFLIHAIILVVLDVSAYISSL